MKKSLYCRPNNSQKYRVAVKLKVTYDLLSIESYLPVIGF